MLGKVHCLEGKGGVKTFTMNMFKIKVRQINTRGIFKLRLKIC